MKIREVVEEKITALHDHFTIAAAVLSPEVINQALMLPKQRVFLALTQKNIMGVKVPEYGFEMSLSEKKNALPYGIAVTSGELDDAVKKAMELMSELLELAQLEKTAGLLAAEIEKTRRRVNALEYVLIPQYRETIRYITMKLEENERGNITRLMKVKDMMIAEQRAKGEV